MSGAYASNADVTGDTAGDVADGAAHDARARAGWTLALRAIELALADPDGLGGVALRGRGGPARDALLAALDARASVHRLSPSIDPEALDDGIDLVASLAAGRSVRRAGLLSRRRDETGDETGGEAHDTVSVTVVAGAERLPQALLSRLGRWLDEPGRDGALVLLDETDEADDDADESLVASSLGERVALHVSLTVPTLHALARCRDEARARAATVHPVDPRYLPAPGPGMETDLATLARDLGVHSSRTLRHALRAARVAAALDGVREAGPEHAALAAQLVLAPRALQAPPASAGDPGDDTTDTTDGNDGAADRASRDTTPPPEDDPAAAREAPPPEAAADASPPADSPGAPPPDRPDTDLSDARDDARDDAGQTPAEALAAAVEAVLPPGLLGSLAGGLVARRASRGSRGRQRGGPSRRGRPTRVRRPRTREERERLDVAATLRAAIPWQRLRPTPPHGGLALRADDFRTRERRAPARTTTLFVVDASGSAAMARIGEAKGAVENLLAECYVRRDRVALVSFREARATLDLPPTRSLVRAKRLLSALPGGGGTPLATALDLAVDVLAGLAKAGDTTACVIMSDGRGNVGRDGLGGRAQARKDAADAARRLGASGARLLWIDTALRPREEARVLAGAMGARYLPLPTGRGVTGLAGVPKGLAA